MSQEILDAEDQMAAELASIRSERVSETQPVVETASAQPVAEPEASTAPAPEVVPQAEPPLDDRVKQAQAELHRLHSEIGRVNALNSKYQQASRELAQLRDEVAQFKRPPPDQPPATKEEAVDRLAQVADQVKDFPELAGIVAAVSDALKQADRKAEDTARRAAAAVIEPLEPLRREQVNREEEQRRAAYDAALQTFNATYPTAAQVVQSDQFMDWLRKQPGPVQYAFAKGNGPDEAMLVMDAYDMHLRRNGHEPIAQIGKPQTEQKPAPARSVANADRLQRAAGIPSRPSGAQGGLPPADDFDAALAHFRRQRLGNARFANA